MGKKRFHWRTIIIAVMALWLMQAGAVLAVDVDYEGPLDSVTGEAAGETTDEDGVSKSAKVQVSEDVIFDREQNAYVYTVGGQQIVSSVVDGMVVQGSVSIVPDAGLSVTLYRGGETLTGEDLTNITKTGEYVLEAAAGGQSTRVLAFSLVGEAVGSITEYAMPSGFVVTTVTRDGEAVSRDRSAVDLSGEGKYHIEYSCARAGISYSLDITVDHTAPELLVEGVDEDGKARGPVTLTVSEENLSGYIEHNDSQGSFKNELTESGDYHVHLEDEAGNSTDEYFTILIYFNGSSYAFIAVVLAVLAATVAYMVLARKRLRVR